MLSLATVSRWQVWELRCWALTSNSTAIFYVDVRKSTSDVNASWNVFPLANHTAESAWDSGKASQYLEVSKCFGNGKDHFTTSALADWYLASTKLGLFGYEFVNSTTDTFCAHQMILISTTNTCHGCSLSPVTVFSWNVHCGDNVFFGSEATEYFFDYSRNLAWWGVWALHVIWTYLLSISLSHTRILLLCKSFLALLWNKQTFMHFTWFLELWRA